MSDALLQSEVVQAIKLVAAALGHAPSKREFYNHPQGLPAGKVMRAFGLWSKAVQAAGIVDESPLGRARKFKYKRSQIDSFSVHEADLAAIFRDAGEPEVLKVIAQPDTHVLYRDVKAVQTFLEFMKWYNPHGHIIMGDYIDAEGISHWPNNSLKPREFIPEVIEARELLHATVRVTPSCVFRAFITGNHEDWIMQAMASKLPEFFNGLDQLGLMPDLEALLDLKKFGYDLIPLNHFLRVGLAHFTHGLYTGPNHAKKHLDIVKGNIYYGHVHDMYETHQPTMFGTIEAVALGCLCRLDAKFLKGKPSNWVHGFGIYEFRRDGTYTFTKIRMNDRSFSFNGKVFG